MCAAVNDFCEEFRPAEVAPLHHDGDIVVRLCEGMRAPRRRHLRYMRLYVILHRAGGELWTHVYRVEHAPFGGKAQVHLLKVDPGNQVAASSQWALERWMNGAFGAESTTPARPSPLSSRIAGAWPSDQAL
ncbi:hypothetical protein [Varunaivibrio sulfuroxidans]|uniref:Uncharacterized protein n=1 Tax=Varunaivibrio sulfuroxidans TaxID=1773489 RepID=A0A4R3J6Z1_9PROT|nr:hypothetical protein [Varunaivibrio sulfuroxidans]TCS61618.1 hypothetical protein EDD55_10726 [Varunaivibrio sulfuroxidans]WES29507.1 hypothetical protein P3M64_07495 [Varunaivibrio sulfuroxidans]